MSSCGKIYIYVDDERNPKNIPNEIDYVVCRTYKDAIYTLEKFIELGFKIILDLDHDIQCKQTGYDIAKWVVHQNYPNLRFLCHSMNAVGKENIVQLLSHYGYNQYNGKEW